MGRLTRASTVGIAGRVRFAVVDRHERVLATAGSPRTRPVTRRCGGTSPGTGNGCGLRRAATASAARGRSGSSRTGEHVVAVRTKTLRVLSYDAELEVLRMLVDRRDELSKAKVQAVSRLHQLLSKLVPGQSKEGLHRLAGQGDSGLGAPPRPGP
jgi:hypothetical protein